MEHQRFSHNLHGCILQHDWTSIWEPSLDQKNPRPSWLNDTLKKWTWNLNFCCFPFRSQETKPEPTLPLLFWETQSFHFFPGKNVNFRQFEHVVFGVSPWGKKIQAKSMLIGFCGENKKSERSRRSVQRQTGVIILPTQTMHNFSEKSFKFYHAICMVWYPPKGEI